MITDAGKRIIAKKLSGISDSCFDYLSLGIGARPPSPKNSSAELIGLHQSQPLMAMNHEVIRVPVISALPMADGTIKCAAEIPSGFAAEFTEVGLWTHRESAGSQRSGSQQICTFQPTERWFYSDNSELSIITTVSGNTDFQLHNAEAATRKAMYSPQSDSLWNAIPSRRVRKEGFRLGKHGILMRGDTSSISGASPSVWTTTNSYIQMPVGGYTFDNAASADELAITYFVSVNSALSSTAPSYIRLSVQFITSTGAKAVWNINRTTATTVTTTINSADSRSLSSISAGATVLRKHDILTSGTALSQFAEFYQGDTSTTGYLSYLAKATGSRTLTVNPIDLQINSSGNAYYSDYIQLGEAASSRMALMYDAGFAWSQVESIRIYGSTSSADHWIGIDSLRFNNVDQMNQSYGMVAYDAAVNYETRGIQLKGSGATNVLFEVQVV
jgi:hypothetical protein